MQKKKVAEYPILLNSGTKSPIKSNANSVSNMSEQISVAPSEKEASAKVP